MLLDTVMILFFPAVLVPSAFAGDSFNIDVNLTEYNPYTARVENPNWYKPDKNYNLDISNSSIVCPSNQCKGIPDEITLILKPDDNAMSLLGKFKLVDDKTNGHFTPKKQKLVEGMNMNFFCTFNDIQEDIAKNITKYICSEPKNTIIAYITRVFNNTNYPYTFTATFETPSGHLVLNATERTYGIQR
jgi:hypothetical protein